MRKIQISNKMIKIILFIYICVSLFMALILTEAVMSHERFLTYSPG